jgi:hypothetical protein
MELDARWIEQRDARFRAALPVLSLGFGTFGNPQRKKSA